MSNYYSTIYIKRCGSSLSLHACLTVSSGTAPTYICISAHSLNAATYQKFLQNHAGQYPSRQLSVKFTTKVFYSRLYDYFSTNNILSSSQFGFRSGASTEHALLKFTDDILKCFADNKVEIATFMDLNKAFDCVDHKILLTKIK